MSIHLSYIRNVTETQIQINPFAGGIAQTNGYFVRFGSETLLIDTPEGAKAFLNQGEFSPQAIFLTHLHFDHVMDAAELKEEYDNPIYAPSAFSPRLTLEELFSDFSPTGPLTVPPF